MKIIIDIGNVAEGFGNLMFQYLDKMIKEDLNFGKHVISLALQFDKDETKNVNLTMLTKNYEND